MTHAVALPIHITALGAASDPSVSMAELERWHEETTKSFAVEAFPGGHQYLSVAPEAAIGLVTRRLRETLGGVDSSTKSAAGRE